MDDNLPMQSSFFCGGFQVYNSSIQKGGKASFPWLGAVKSVDWDWAHKPSFAAKTDSVSGTNHNLQTIDAKTENCTTKASTTIHCWQGKE